MSLPTDPWASVANDSLGTLAGPSPANATVLSPEERYDRQSLLGRGAMGEVWLARDVLLGREVAWKRGMPGGAQVLEREAALAARLEHPNIVPILDAGILADGSPWLAMRLVRGQTLGDWLSRDLSRTERLALLRPLLAACQAVAHAHRHGVVHRDLKPDNVMIGAFGEAQVVDWGLAASLQDAATEVVPVGTPLTMSPEVAQGKGATPASDVYSLGALLYQLVSTSPLREGSAQTVLAAARATTTLPSFGAVGDAPPDLIAIVQRCLRPEPADRYPDATPLAEDLAAFLDGRRVGAYQYTPRDLALRLLKAWRWPLVVAGIAALVVVVLAIGSFWRIQQARDRAEQAKRDALTAAQTATKAEEQAREALAAADQALATAVAENASTLLADGYPTAAAAAAQQSLQHGPAPVAVGVLAAVLPPAPVAHPEALPWTELRCKEAVPGVLDPDLLATVCLDDDQVALHIGSQARWRRQLATTDAALAGSQVAVLMADPVTPALQLLDAATGADVGPPRSIGPRLRISPAGPRFVVWNPGNIYLTDSTTMQELDNSRCKAMTALAVSPDGQWLARSCPQQPLYVGTVDQLDRYALPLDLAAGDEWPSALALSRDGRWLAGGGPRGRWIWWDTQTGQVARMQAPTGMTKSVALTADGHWVALTVERGESVLWRPSYPFGRWPLSEANAVYASGQNFLLAGGPSPGLQAQAVVPGLTTTPHVWNAPDQRGLAGAAVSADGRRLAVAGGAGEVWLLDAATGELVAQRTWRGGVAKRPAFSPDGNMLAVPALGLPGIARVDAETLADGGPVLPLAVRRAAWLANGALAIVPFVPIGLVTIVDQAGDAGATGHPGSRTSGGDAEPMADAAATPDGKTVLWLGEHSGAVWHLDATYSATPSLVATVPGGMVLGLAANGGWAVVATAAELVWLERNRQQWREVGRTPAADHRWLSVAVAAGGQWAAASAADGVVGVWRRQAQTPVAWLRGHQGHVSQVLVSPDDAWLWSTGWDGTLRRWQTNLFGPAR